jgi:hypothetical protein
MSPHRLRDLQLKIRELMASQKARGWLLDQCDKHLKAWRGVGWRLSPFNSDGSVATNLTLVEKAIALVAFHEFASADDAFQLGPAPYPEWQLDHGSREYGIRWGIVVSETKDRFRSEYGFRLEAWLKDVLSAMQAELKAPEAAEAHLSACSLHAAAVSDQQHDRLHIDDIDSFEKVRSVQPSTVTQFLEHGRIEISEDSVKSAIEEILQVAYHHQDRPNELDDIYTANVIVKGSRRSTAFLLKGPGIGKKEMTIADCGKNGDQIVRPFDAPADLFIVQFIGRIAEMVIKDVEGKTAALHKGGKKAQFLIIDGQDTARLLFAYGKLGSARNTSPTKRLAGT